MGIFCSLVFDDRRGDGDRRDHRIRPVGRGVGRRRIASAGGSGRIAADQAGCTGCTIGDGDRSARPVFEWLQRVIGAAERQARRSRRLEFPPVVVGKFGQQHHQEHLQRRRAVGAVGLRGRGLCGRLDPVRRLAGAADHDLLQLRRTDRAQHHVQHRRLARRAGQFHPGPVKRRHRHVNAFIYLANAQLAFWLPPLPPIPPIGPFAAVDSASDLGSPIEALSALGPVDGTEMTQDPGLAKIEAGVDEGDQTLVNDGRLRQRGPDSRQRGRSRRHHGRCRDHHRRRQDRDGRPERDHTGSNRACRVHPLRGERRASGRRARRRSDAAVGQAGEDTEVTVVSQSGPRR